MHLLLHWLYINTYQCNSMYIYIYRYTHTHIYIYISLFQDGWIVSNLYFLRYNLIDITSRGVELLPGAFQPRPFRSGSQLLAPAARWMALAMVTMASCWEACAEGAGVLDISERFRWVQNTTYFSDVTDVTFIFVSNYSDVRNIYNRAGRNALCRIIGFPAPMTFYVYSM